MITFNVLHTFFKTFTLQRNEIDIIDQNNNNSSLAFHRLVLHCMQTLSVKPSLKRGTHEGRIVQLEQKSFCFTCNDVPIMIRRSALGKSSECRKYFCGRSSPKKTTSGFTVPAQKEHVGTSPLMMATCGGRVML